MTARRSKGFTLIELLVVIAIIGILAAMLFPVFARARESARKTQCLANVKNIALAINMYLTDYDKFPPKEHRKEVLAYFDEHPGGKTDQWENDDPPLPCGETHINPYLRWAVILDDYIKNREVWRCPSAKMASSPEAIIAGNDWFATVKAGIDGGVFGRDLDVCIKDNTFPPGWGGDVTDSLVQRVTAGGGGVWNEGSGGSRVPTFGVVVNATYELNTSQVDDAAQFVIVGDGGAWMEWTSPGLMAYPDLCTFECGNCMGWADWVNCASWAADCGLFSIAPKDGSLLKDRTKAKPFTRHLGGSNVGFMDGHAKWYTAEGLLAAHKEASEKSNGDGGLGLWTWGPTSTNWASTCGWPQYASDPNQPTIY